MSLVFSTATRSARAEATVGQFDKAATAGRLELYTTTQPDPGAAAGGSPIATITLHKPCGTVTNGVIAFAVSVPVQILSTGAVLWARGVDGDGNWVCDGNVAVTGTAGAAFTLDDVTLYAGAFVFLFNATLSEP